MSNVNHLRKYSVLLVDDESKTLKYFKKAFSRDFRVITCHSAAEAMVVLEDRHEEIAVLITDQRMPVQEGVTLLKTVSQQYPNIIRMLSTAYSSLDDAIRAVNEGAVFRYVSKPWNLDVLKKDLSDGIKHFLMRKKELDLLEERKASMLTLGGVLAHEMRTPLLAITTAGEGIKEYLPALFVTYKDALQRGTLHNGEPFQIVPKSKLMVLETIGQDMQDIISQANIFIDTLLQNAKNHHIDPSTFSSCSALGCIEKAVSQYPLDPEERDNIIIDKSVDFQFDGSNVLFIYAIFNLIRNALYALAMVQRGEITIRMERQQDKNIIFFRDTGAGIPENALPRIFDDFYSSKRSSANVGIGLGYCRQTIESFFGTITCHSKEGVYTEFVITLPLGKR